jgi:hypothetical protein
VPLGSSVPLDGEVLTRRGEAAGLRPNSLFRTAAAVWRTCASVICRRSEGKAHRDSKYKGRPAEHLVPFIADHALRRVRRLEGLAEL